MSSKNSREIEYVKKVIDSWGAKSEQQLSSPTISAEKNDSWDKLIEAMAIKISDLLTNQPQKLYQALYRLDVSEEKVAALMSGKLLSDRKISKAHALAELILERELQKAKTRGEFDS